MATEEIAYLAYAEAVGLHIELMRYLGETRYGVADRTLTESALARPMHAAAYADADLIARGNLDILKQSDMLALFCSRKCQSVAPDAQGIGDAIDVVEP